VHVKLSVQVCEELLIKSNKYFLKTLHKQQQLLESAFHVGAEKMWVTLFIFINLKQLCRKHKYLKVGFTYSQPTKATVTPKLKWEQTNILFTFFNMNKTAS